MTDTKPTAPKTEAGGFAVKDALNAPIVFFDGAPNFGCTNGIVNVTLAAGRHLANGNGGVDVDVVAVAFLRCNIPAAMDLRKALDDAILLGAPPADGGRAN